MDGDTDDEERVVDLDRYWADPITSTKWGPRGTFKEKRNIVRWSPEKEAEEKAMKGRKKRRAAGGEASNTRATKKAKSSDLNIDDIPESSHDEELEDQEEEEDSLFVPEG
jgi:hypothetical protein